MHWEIKYTDDEEKYIDFAGKFLDWAGKYIDGKWIDESEKSTD